ncbi:hypothetical protein ACOTVS_10065 [Aliarcobacter butzleri]|uniref:hypothetical protein n=1 Tax=Aliarcobacter butzleri TaxID=28197 RepID=UPI00345099CD
MGWIGKELENSQSELDCILEEITSESTTYVNHSYNEQEGVYYIALKYNNEVTATIVSMNSYKGEKEEGWIYFKIISEFAGPIYLNPSLEVFNALTKNITPQRYEWRKYVRRRFLIKRIGKRK